MKKSAGFYQFGHARTLGEINSFSNMDFVLKDSCSVESSKQFEFD